MENQMIKALYIHDGLVVIGTVHHFLEDRKRVLLRNDDTFELETVRIVDVEILQSDEPTLH